MRVVQRADFDDAVGTVYSISAQEGECALTLTAAESLGADGREGGSFRLEFRGPVDPVLPQGTYEFAADGEALDIFVVPIARDDRGTVYEAIFN